SSGALIVTYRERPSLQVTEASGPTAPVTAGTVIDAQWTVANLGNAATPGGGSRWNDGVYLSLDNQLDGGDVLLGTRQNGSALDIGDSYTSNASFTLPGDIAGNVFLIVKPDTGGRVDQIPMAGVDYVAIPLAIEAVPVPPPDLVMTLVSAPPEVFDGNSFTVRWTVDNRGIGPTQSGFWTDTVWLTYGPGRPDSSRGDFKLGTFGHNGVLEVGDAYTNSASVQVPEGVRGQFFITVWTNSSNHIFETQLETNVNPEAPNDLVGSNYRTVPLSVLRQPSADLVVTEVSAPETGKGGETVTLRWTVENQGAVATDLDRWVDSVYLSSEATLDTPGGRATRVFAAPNFGTLAPGQSYTQEVTFTLPPSAEGAYFIVQTNEDPRILNAVEGSLMAEVTAVVKRIEAALGSPLSEINLADVQSLSRNQLIRILAGEQASPKQVYEGGLTDNNALGAASTVTPNQADLVVSNVSATPSVFSGETITVSWTVTNEGSDAVWSGTRGWNDWVVISPHDTFAAGGYSALGYLPQLIPTPLAPGESYTASAEFRVPEGVEGDFYLYVAIDPAVGSRPFRLGFDPPGAAAFPGWPDAFGFRAWETVKTNNLGPAVPLEILYREADLRIDTVESPAEADSGGFFTIEYSATNVGGRDTRDDRWRDRVYLSRDGSLDAFDKLIGTVEHVGVVAAGESYSGTIEARLPDNIDGAFNLIVIVNAGFGDATPPWVFPGRLTGGGGSLNEYRDLASNTLVRPLNVIPQAGVDLTVKSIVAPERATQGRGFELTYTVSNTGEGSTPERQDRWVDHIFLSRDTFLDTSSDHYVGRVIHDGGLGAGESYTESLDLVLPRGITGDYYVFVVTDYSVQPRGAVVEVNELNNAVASDIPMLIELPPPADLVVTAVTAPGNVRPGETATFTLTITNQGTERAEGTWTDGFYLSTDAVWDVGDRLLGTVSSGRTVAPGQSYTVEFTAPVPAALPGTYRIVARTDLFNDIHEAENENNNTGVSLGPVPLEVPTLTLGAAYEAELRGGGELLLRVFAPSGDTLRFVLDSLDTLREWYRQRESDLVVVRGNAPEELARLADEYDAEGVSWAQAYSGLGRRRDDVERFLRWNILFAVP
ncbi:MAG: CARDB domain-containing protein, partial [Opitutales bacterium]